LNRAADGFGLLGEDFGVAFEFHAIYLVGLPSSFSGRPTETHQAAANEPHFARPVHTSQKNKRQSFSKQLKLVLSIG